MPGVFVFCGGLGIVPLPERLARFNRRATNHVLGPLARYLPPLALVRHIGRSSGRIYETPVLAFPHAGQTPIALTYGADTDWVANVLAAGACDIVRRNGERRYIRPLIRDDSEALDLLPAYIRPPLRLLRVTEVLVLEEATEGAPG